MDSDSSRTTGIILLLLSLLFHLLLLLFLFIFQTDQRGTFDLEHQPLDAQLLDPQQTQQQQQQDDNEIDIDHEVLIDLLAQGVDPNNTLTDDPGELVTPPAEEGQPEDEPATPDNDDGAQETPMPPELPKDMPPAPEPLQGAQLPEPLADTLYGQQTPPQEQKALTPKQAVKKIVRKMVQRPPITPAQAQALSKLAQGFMQSMSAELGHSPSDDPTQLAHQRYMTKIWNNLKQTMNAEDNILAVTNNVDTRAVLVLTINKQGKLLNAILRHSRKNPDINKIENMLLTNAHKVGLFPPLPESFKRDEVTFVMPMHLRAHQGVHSGYRLQVEQ